MSKFEQLVQMIEDIVTLAIEKDSSQGWIKNREKWRVKFKINMIFFWKLIN